ncbi:hypothetical protein AC1031_003829 [Aphanomyces cochlioides]|nr:hypothetical protein AC1031_003829 [Aphanomyces cochlioides]
MNEAELSVLREKYSAANVASLGIPHSVVGAESSSSSASFAICWQCQGQRIEKVMYNYMVMERTCEACNGEGVVRRKPIDVLK